MSTTNVINQKEYLKKYLGVGKAYGEKRKKKKDKNLTNRLKVIDDDIVDYDMSKEIQQDIAAADEDAPQIVAVIDDRPPSLRVDEKTNSLLWEPIGEDNYVKSDVTLKMSSFQLKKAGLENQNILSSKSKSKAFSKIKGGSFHKDNKAGDVSHLYKNEQMGPEADNLRKSKHGDKSPLRKSKEISDKYEARKGYNRKFGTHSGSKIQDKNSFTSPSGENNEEYLDKTIKTEPSNNDMSPTRRNDQSLIKSDFTKDMTFPQLIKKEQSDSDVSPPRRNHSSGRNSDSSPPRRKQKCDSDGDISPLRRRNNIDEDFSPPRRKRRSPESSPVKYNKKQLSDSDGDISPPRKKSLQKVDQKSFSHSDRIRKETRGNISSSRSNILSSKDKKDISPPRKNKRQKSKSPSRDRRSHSRWGKWSPDHNESSTSINKPGKTLSGKRAGLQSAKELSEELTALKQKEDQIFQNMSEEVSGRNATTVVRGQKDVDPEEEARKVKKAKEMKEKYDRWGKGLKQFESDNQKMAEELYEMSKPLARYADDEDLEKYLKEQEREGDPMLAYIRKKKRKTKVEAGIPEKPMYMGDFMPNRFSIKPGYRWDGVDRSNGYEKRWYEKYNARKAVQEDAFKWSTEDM